MDVSAIYRKMFTAVFRPRNIEEYSKEGNTVKQGVEVYLLAWAVTLVLGMFSTALVMGGGSAELQEVEEYLRAQFGEGPFGADDAGMFVLTSAISAIFGMLALYVGVFLGAKCAQMVFGGKGNFVQQFYNLALLSGGITIVLSAIGVVQSLLPMAVLLTSSLSLALFAYLIYLSYRSVRAVEGTELLGSVVSTIVVGIGMFFVLLVVELAMLGLRSAMGVA